MGSPGGYQINPGMYRVPDLLTEDQFVAYMHNTYGVKVEFTHDGDKPSAARALGRSRPQGALGDEDYDSMDPAPINDPVLRDLNNRNFGPEYAGTVKSEEKTEDKSDEFEENKGPETTKTSAAKASTTTTKK